MLFAKDDHASNPPETWLVEGEGRSWRLTTQDGQTMQSFSRKRDAEEAKRDSFLTRLYDLERRWYAGERIQGWKDYRP